MEITYNNNSGLIDAGLPLLAVNHDDSLSGKGTKASPLRVSSQGLSLTDIPVDASYSYGEDIMTNGTFEDGTGWTATNWTIASNKATHTTGNTSALSYTLSGIETDRIVKIVVTLSDRTAGSVSVKWAGSTVQSISSNNTYTMYTGTAGTASPVLSFVPGTTFNGSISAISIYYLEEYSPIFTTTSDLQLIHIGANKVLQLTDTPISLLPSKSYLLQIGLGNEIAETNIGSSQHQYVSVVGHENDFGSVALSTVDVFGSLNFGNLNTALSSATVFGSQNLGGATSISDTTLLASGSLVNIASASAVTAVGRGLFGNVSGNLLLSVAMGFGAGGGFGSADVSNVISIGAYAGGGAGNNNTVVGANTAGTFSSPSDFTDNVVIGNRAFHVIDGTSTNNVVIGADCLYLNGYTGIGINNTLVIDSGNAFSPAFVGKFDTKQFGIGLTDMTFANGAALQVDSTTGGILPPRLTTAQRDALTPTAGLIIYNSTTNKHQGYNGSTWNDLY